MPVETQVQSIIEDLSLADRAYFAKDRLKVIKAKIDEAIALLDTKPIESQGKHFRAIFVLDLDKKQKAHLLYLRGRIMDFIPEYSKQAEEHLSKAIKLMPTKVEAWDALGHVYWKKNDLTAS